MSEAQHRVIPVQTQKSPSVLTQPHVNHHLAKSLLSSESIPEPVHMFNKRLRHAARVNMEIAPGTRLFPMNGMVHLPTSDGQRADKSYAPPDHCSHVAVDGAVETSNKLKGITPSITSKVPFDITGTGSYKHDIIAGREDALRPPCNQEPKGGSAGVIMADAIDTSWATDALCAQISVVHKPRQSSVFVTSKNAVLQDPDYGNATTSKNQKTAATDFTSKVGRNADHIAIHGHGPSFPCSQVKKSSSRSQQAAMVDNLYNQMNLQPEGAENIKLGDQLHIQNTSNVDAASIQNGTGVTYVGENWLEVQHPPVRFPLTIVHLRYFYILCGLGKSKWKDYVAVRLSEATTVTWESFAESIEPNGHCSNFFIAAFCRKFFEECHPSKSKKHFFYPKVGYAMMHYDRARNTNTVRSCFLGANSAMKLRLSDKIYFPICHMNHWFLFIVDLKNSCYVFLDSYYDQTDPFQREVSTTLVKVFETAWSLYAGSSTNLSSFRILYPPVPKQTTMNDCGIFVIKYMEYWDFHTDLRLKFSQEDIPKIRILLANDLYFSDKNTEDKTLVNNLFKQGIDAHIVN